MFKVSMPRIIRVFSIGNALLKHEKHEMKYNIKYA